MRRILTILTIVLAIFGAWAIIRLIMQAVPPPPPPRLIPNPTTLDFGQVYVGQTSSRKVDYTNFSPQAANLISTGTNDVPFSFEGTSFTAQVLQQGQTISDLEFYFSPVAKGTFTGRGGVVRMPPGPQVNKVGLTGEGINSEAHGDLWIEDPRAQPQEFLDFGNVVVGQSADLSVRVHNRSQTQDYNVRVIFGGMSQAYDVFPPGRNLQIPKNSSIAIVIRFTPRRTIEYRSFIIVEVMRTPVIPSAAHYTGMRLVGVGVAAGGGGGGGGGSSGD